MALALHHTFNDEMSNESLHGIHAAQMVNSQPNSLEQITSLENSHSERSFSENQFSKQQGTLHESEAYPGELALLRCQSQQHEQLIDVMPTGMIMLDGNGVVIKINKVARQLLDEPILGQPWFDVIQRSFNPREDDWHEVSLKDGRRVKLEITPLGSQPGQLIMITDLTQTRLMQDKIGQLQRLSSLGRMVSTLAHQIRTPLSAAMLYSANLTNSKLNENARQNFQEKLSSRLQDLEQQVNDMLLFSKSGTEQVVAPVCITALINDSVQSVEALINKAKAKVNIQLNTQEGKQEAQQQYFVLGNKNALMGAMQNLIHNALNAFKPNDLADHCIINIQVYSLKNDIYISVKDNGKGINNKLADKIFEPFYTSTTQGTGLGLAVVKSVANAHQGEVSLLDDSSSGAHFCIKLPLMETPVQENNHECA